MLRPASIGAAALALALAAPAASAQGREDPQRLYQQGVAAFQARDFSAALARWKRAYALTQRPELLANVGLTFERLGRPEDAADAYRRYLAASPGAADRAEVESRIARLTPAPAAAPVAPAPAPPAQPVAPPPHRVVASPVVWPWVALGTGAALAVGGAVMLAVPGDPGADPSVVTERQYLDARDSRTTLQAAGAVLGVVGLAVVAVGVVGLVTRAPPPATRTSWDLRWQPLPSGGTVRVGRAF